MGKLKIGVFGGYRGQTMIKLLMGHPDAVLVAVCDKNEAVLEKVKAEAEENNLSVKLFRTFEDFIEYDMDAVVLANYANEHATYAVKALKKGKHVLSEVLPCETMAQAVELIETVEETGLVYAYAENYCYMTHSFEMWKRYKRGDIGEIQYGEGEYIHDCMGIWPEITYGDRTHWRNRMYATFYCTHSVGPLLTISGLRPVSVVGFETVPNERFTELGCFRGTGIEMITLENGAVIKSIHGDLKREPHSYSVQVYGKKGMMESERYNEKQFNIYIEGEEFCKGDWEKYDPKDDIVPELSQKVKTHNGSDFFPTHFFIQKILGREQGKWSIDVYTAVNMGICGILAWRSVLDGNKPVRIPDLRNREERDLYRNDRACCTPEVAGDELLPRSSFPYPDIPDSVYENVKKISEERFEERLKRLAKRSD